MNQDYFKSWAALVTEMHKPFQAMMELNLKTLKSLHYLKPEEASSWQQPQKLVDHQLKFAVENSHQMLDYMRQSFQILENAFSLVSRELKKNSAQTAEKVKSAMPVSKTIPVKKASSTSAKKRTPVKAKATSSLQKKSAAPKKTAIASGKMATAKKATVQSKKAASKPASKSAASKSAKSMPSSQAKKTALKNKTASRSVAKSQSAKRPVTMPNKVAKAVSPASKPSMTSTKIANPAAQRPQSKMMPQSKVAMPAAKMAMPANKMTLPESKPVMSGNGKSVMPSNPNPAVMFRHNEKMPEPKK